MCARARARVCVCVCVYDGILLLHARYCCDIMRDDCIDTDVFRLSVKYDKYHSC